MKYTSASKYLLALPEAYDRQTPDRMNLLMQKLGRAHMGHRCVFAHGGELGFAAAKYLESVLLTAGYRVMLLTSRTSGDFRECISLGGQPLDHVEFAALTLEVQRAVKAVKEQSTDIGEFSRFEIIFAIGMLAGNCHGCEFLILNDTDCKNGACSVCEPIDICLLSVVDSDPTAIKLSCQNILKGTREVIGFLQGNGAYKAVSDACAAVGCRMTIPAVSEQKITDITPSAVKFSYRGRDGFELKNSSNIAQTAALLAAETVYSLRRAGIRINPSAVLGGLSHVRLPLVFECVSLMPRIIIDTSETAGEVAFLAYNFGGRAGLSVCCENTKENLVNAGYFDNCKLLTVGDGGSYPDATSAAEGLVELLTPNDRLLVLGRTVFAEKMKQEIRAAFDRKSNGS